MSSQTLQHLKNNFDILFLQGIHHTTILYHIYAYGSGTKATIASKISQDKTLRGERGSILVCSPRLSRFITPVQGLDTEGLLAAAILSLLGAPFTLLVSIYAPGTDVHRLKIENLLRLLMQQYPSHVSGGDTNDIMCPERDGANLQTDKAWPCLWRLVTSDPPRLIDTFRHFDPAARSFSRYPSQYRASSSRLDQILVSRQPQNSSPRPPQLTEQERSKYHDSLAPLAKWCESTLPCFDSLSSADIESFTDAVLEEVATSYHTITAPSTLPPQPWSRKSKRP